MKKQTTTSQPTPATDADNGGNVTPIADAKLRKGESVVNAWDVINSEQSKAAADAHQLKSQTRQKLAEVADLATERNADDKALAEASAEVSALLYQGRRDGILTADEMNAMLGDSFGFKKKGDAKAEPVPAGHKDASKTPAGQGEAIRKRVVRAVDAATYVQTDGEEATRFFDGIERSKVAALLTAVDNGERSVFTLYSDLADLRTEGSTGRLPAMQDAKQIAKLAALALEPATIELAVKSASIRAAMAELYRALGVAGQAVAEGMAKQAA